MGEVKRKEMTNEIKKIGKNGALAILSQIPVVSGFSKFFEDFVQDCWQERIDLWKKEVVERLAKLDTEMEQKIRDTSNFASILASAQRGALEDMEEDKVALYANAVINAIKNEDINNAKKHIFLNMLRDFTSLHIKVLMLFSCPHQPDTGFQKQVHLNMPTNYDIIVGLEPGLDVGEDSLELILTDLKSKSLINISWLDEAIKSVSSKKQTTPIADEFLAFINEQKDFQK